MHETPPSEPAEGGAPARRGFVSFLSFVIGLVITGVPAVIAAAFTLDPVLRKRKTAAGEAGDAPAEGFTKVANIKALPDDGTPVNFRVIMDVVDAWTTYLDQPVGAVFLRKLGENKVSCFNQTCPHLGCDVSYRATGKGGEFKCPCHDSAFKLDGEKLNDIPPRGLDPLETIVSENGDIWVKYQKFESATSERKPIA